MHDCTDAQTCVSNPKKMKKLIITPLALLIGLYLTAQNPNLSFEKIWAERIDAATYHIHFEEQPSALYKGDAVASINWDMSISLTESPLKMTVNPNERFGFAAVYDQDTLYFSERYLNLDQIINFRDIGGIPTKEGRTVKWESIYRCGDLGNPSERDFQFLDEANLASVMDFRKDYEIARSKDTFPAGKGTEHYHIEIGKTGSENNPNMLMALFQDPNATAEIADSVFNLYYKHYNIKDYIPYFDVLLNSDGTVLFHCSAGKDRTGIGAALLLHALGVDYKYIEEDYYLSNRYTAALFENRPEMNSLNQEVLKVIAGVHPKYLKTTFDAIKAEYGSIDKALEKGIGLTSEQRQLLIEKYTF